MRYTSAASSGVCVCVCVSVHVLHVVKQRRMAAMGEVMFAGMGCDSRGAKRSTLVPVRL